MRINIKATGFDMTPSLQEYIETKMGELEKFVKTMSGEKDNSEGVNVFVEVAKTRLAQKKGDDLFKAELQFHVPGFDRIVVTVEASNIHKAVDKGRIEMRNRLQRHKTKQQSRFLRSAAKWKRLTRINLLARRRQNNNQEYDNGDI